METSPDPDEPAATRRLFIAVMLPAELQEKLAGLVRLLDEHRAILRPVRSDALHFTLRFLGNLTAAQQEGAAESCAAATAGVAAFPLAIGGFGVFPHARAPRVVWLGLLAGDAPLVALQRRVEDELLQRRIVTRREDFTPHLTLARVRSEAGTPARRALGTAVAALPRRDEARTRASGVSLVHSLLTPHGSRYTVLAEYQLE